MRIKLQKANMEDCRNIHKMQVIAFKELLDKYQDYDTSPAAESVEKIIIRMNQPGSNYYLIKVGDDDIGAVRIVHLPEKVIRVSPVFILPQFQNIGYAQEVFLALEKMFPDTLKWKLDTIKEEKKLCYLYEKIGYFKTGKEKTIKPEMTIVFYEKSTG